MKSWDGLRRNREQLMSRPAAVEGGTPNDVSMELPAVLSQRAESTRTPSLLSDCGESRGDGRSVDVWESMQRHWETVARQPDSCRRLTKWREAAPELDGLCSPAEVVETIGRLGGGRPTMILEKARRGAVPLRKGTHTR